LHFLLSGRFGEVHTMRLFWSVAVFYVCMVLLRAGLIYIRDLIQERVGLNLETVLRHKTYGKLMELDSATVSEYNSGELLQVLNGDTVMFKELLSHRIPYFGDSIFMLVTTLIIIVGINLSFLIIPLILMPFLVTAVRRFKARARMNFKEIRKKSAEMNLTVQENIAAVRIVRSFTNEELETEKFEESNLNLFESRRKQIWLQSKFDVTFNTIKQIAYIGSVIIGGILAIRGHISVGYILASSTYVTRIMNNITGLNNHIFIMQQSMIAGAALKNFMDKDSNVPDNKSSKLNSQKPDIELKNVSLEIDDQQILKNINLKIPYGKKIGIVGETGSGKSMLLKTLLRICDITGGKITVDGHDIKEFGLENLRDMYSFVFQEVFLFSDTIESNIAYSSADIDKTSVYGAARRAMAEKFIDDFAEGYETIIGERGLGISGGQKQRISIARAFYKNAPVFVLDDSTSALDVNTERSLLQNINDNFSDKTVIITAHRFSSVVDCDEILYMRDGEIAERGTFAELIAEGGSFARIYEVQQSSEEALDYDALAEKEV
ncbi:MAG: ABC transporter ATP-binding protein, partial [Oscillospiraceae bacterium]|nr:ABC transporter ATP-binding protein [Oscillospiraceae bacterium]